MPQAGFLAAPQVPSRPRAASPISRGLSAAVLGTSFLPQLIGSPTPVSGIRRLISDTDTSLPEHEEQQHQEYDESVDPG